MKCPFCSSENTAEAEECRICGAGIDAKSRETAELRAEALESSKSVQVFTTLSPTGLQIIDGRQKLLPQFKPFNRLAALPTPQKFCG